MSNNNTLYVILNIPSLKLITVYKLPTVLEVSEVSKMPPAQVV